MFLRLVPELFNRSDTLIPHKRTLWCKCDEGYSSLGHKSNYIRVNSSHRRESFLMSLLGIRTKYKFIFFNGSQFPLNPSIICGLSSQQGSNMLKRMCNLTILLRNERRYIICSSLIQGTMRGTENYKGILTFVVHGNVSLQNIYEQYKMYKLWTLLQEHYIYSSSAQNLKIMCEI